MEMALYGIYLGENGGMRENDGRTFSHSEPPLKQADDEPFSKSDPAATVPGWSAAERKRV